MSQLFNLCVPQLMVHQGSVSCRELTLELIKAVKALRKTLADPEAAQRQVDLARMEAVQRDIDQRQPAHSPPPVPNPLGTLTPMMGGSTYPVVVGNSGGVSPTPDSLAKEIPL